jgi:Na+:H+ antiporter, NhaA family
VTSARTTTRSSSRHLIAQLSAPVRRFIATEAASAALLVVATVIALLWVNSPWGDSYDRFWHTDFTVQFGAKEVSGSLQHWVNEGLMVFFFFLIGMEVRRELQMGELTQRNRLSVPTLAALAGLVVPALVYTAINAGGPGAHGWGIAMATDTAFLLGVLALVGPRCPTQLRVFLLSLSVVDDIGALSAIAVFYSDDIDLVALSVAGLCVLAFYLLTRWQVWRGPFYFAVGVVMWLSMEASGVSPTIGGVVLGLLVSAYPPRRSEVESAGLLTRAFRQSPDPALARQAKLSVERAISPNERIGALLVPWSGYVVVPVFALANAGVPLSADLMAQAVTSPVTIGVFVALVAGKFLGVGVAATAAVRLRLGQLPPGVDLRSVWGGAVLSGLGFTVSLFVTDLAFDDPELQDEARVGILAAAITAAALGALWFRVLGRRDSAEEAPAARRLDPPVDPERDHVRGASEAPVTVVEYGDFECPYCGQAEPVVRELLRDFGEEVRYVWRHLPLHDVHPHAQLAAEAAEAAADQDAFWEMHDLLLDNQDALRPDDLVAYAEQLGLDVERFTDSLREHAGAARVAEDIDSADLSGVSGTPTFFINSRRQHGAYDIGSLSAAVRAAGARATLASTSAG